MSVNFNNVKGVYKFLWGCGRNGDLEGVFISTTKEVNEILGKEIDFGEVLGKHSEICGTIDKGDITLVTHDPAVVKVIEDHGLTSGYNPFDYLEE